MIFGTTLGKKGKNGELPSQKIKASRVQIFLGETQIHILSHL